MNAQQLKLSGVALVCRDTVARVNLVAVEGGPRGVRKFTRLMLNRIKWNGDDNRASREGVEEDEEEDDGGGMDIEDGSGGGTGLENRCSLVWSGESHLRSFKSFAFQENRCVLFFSFFFNFLFPLSVCRLSLSLAVYLCLFGCSLRRFFSLPFFFSGR